MSTNISNTNKMNYFIMERENNNNYPLLDFADSESDKLLHKAMREASFIGLDFVMKLRLGKPIPKKYEMVDHHALPRPVVSFRVKNIIDQQNNKYIQLVPSEINTPAGILKYFLIHVFTIDCLDKAQSKLTLNSHGEIFEAKTIALDFDVLNKIPYEERMLFRLCAGIDYYLIEKELVNEILKINPKGFRFTPVDQWTYLFE